MGDFLTVQGHLPTRGSAWDTPLCPCLSAGHFSLLNPGSKARAWLDQELVLERRENDYFGIAYCTYYVPGLNEVHHYSIISQAFIC